MSAQENTWTSQHVHDILWLPFHPPKARTFFKIKKRQAQDNHMKSFVSTSLIALLTLISIISAESDFDFPGESLKGQQIVRAQNINFSGEYRAYGNNPNDFDLGQALKEGYVVVISFFQNTCVNCVFEMPWLDELAKKYIKEKLLVIFIDLSDPEKDRKALTEKYVAKIGISQSHCYYDTFGSIRKAYQVSKDESIAVPVLYVIGKDFRFKYAKLGWVKENQVAEYKRDFESKLVGWLKE
ncbi:MAG: TlpA family protein disulfide reductase [Alphaproteobacteria bacterium]|nr:TlpA family protein disulfide reductase [Alphaproteobacteria bacterium]